MGLSAFDQFLWLASATLAAAVACRIYQQRLFVAPFSAFAVMLVAVVARDITMSVPRYNSRAYTFLWEGSLPFLLAAQIWVGLDSLKAIRTIYPKFGSFALRLFGVCLFTSIIGCSLVLPLELRRLTGEAALLRTLFLTQRWVDSSLAGTLVLVSLFFARFPAPIRKPPRNLVWHILLLSIYFSGYGVLFFVENLTPLGGAVLFERLQCGLVVLLYAIWGLALSRRGQESEQWPKTDVMVLKIVARG